ncbi:DUF2513 domain-containing protein [Pediococcus pentosaceus]|uniref:DUF2513 domain-containing protein n=1 Tax=Pediococcus pentosaceus TaxID=1255 RepID=UPI001E59BFD1|nr:DUF2513 domain-containing protein [Pediococcus pentosaceus]MCG7196756.1 DUF2513 domain-containing protein [Pediococcus pentosaceus]MCI2396428.1 DUF2513 domain-containing protein [Pediococcus pentosaceus]
MDYFTFYKLMLSTVEKTKVTDAYQLKEKLNYLPEILHIIKTKEDGILLSEQFQETLENLIDDGLIKGRTVKTKDSNLYLIQGLSTTGHQYLKNLKNPKFLEKVKNVLKEEGLPVTPTSITRTIAKLFL